MTLGTFLLKTGAMFFKLLLWCRCCCHRCDFRNSKVGFCKRCLYIIRWDSSVDGIILDTRQANSISIWSYVGIIASMWHICHLQKPKEKQQPQNKTQGQMVLDPGNIISQQNICVRRKRRRIYSENTLVPHMWISPLLRFCCPSVVTVCLL